MSINISYPGSDYQIAFYQGRWIYVPLSAVSSGGYLSSFELPEGIRFEGKGAASFEGSTIKRGQIAFTAASSLSATLDIRLASASIDFTGTSSLTLSAAGTTKNAAIAFSGQSSLDITPREKGRIGTGLDLSGTSSLSMLATNIIHASLAFTGQSSFTAEIDQVSGMARIMHHYRMRRAA